MGMQFFGLGEYPYKTILKSKSCESIASDLGNNLGYGTHVVHNNGGNFFIYFVKLIYIIFPFIIFSFIGSPSHSDFRIFNYFLSRVSAVSLNSDRV